MADLAQQIKECARGLGFEVAAITSVEPLMSADQAFNRWISEGFAAGMDYMTRRPELHAHPRRLVPRAQSLITLSANYYTTAPQFEHRNRYGRVARYAWGRDYHEVVRPRLHALAGEVERLAGRPVNARCFVDAVPLLERAAAARAGLGFFGKNTNLLQPRSGSWFFLAEILLDLDVPPEDNQIKISCGTCRRCIEACPTGAFVGEYLLDSRLCISYLTIENKGAIPRELRAGIGEWVFGCDVCQDVCPFNRFATETAWPELQPDAGAGSQLDISELLSIATDQEFKARFQGTPLTRPKRRGLLRNAAVVAANILATAAVPALTERIERDPEPLIRGHALWSLSKLDPSRARGLAEAARFDSDSFVMEEAGLILESS